MDYPYKFYSMTPDEQIEYLEAENDALRSALVRTEVNLTAAINGRPVRDLAENLAENAAALNRTRLT